LVVECCYVEGSITSVQLLGPTGEVESRTFREAFVNGQAVVSRPLAPGRYTLVTGQQPCQGNCDMDVTRTAVVDGCRQAVDVEPGRFDHVLLAVVPGRGCTAQVAGEPFAGPVADEIALRTPLHLCGWTTASDADDGAANPDGRRCLRDAARRGRGGELDVFGAGYVQYARALPGGGGELIAGVDGHWSIRRCESLTVPERGVVEGAACSEREVPAPGGRVWASGVVVDVDATTGEVRRETEVPGEALRVLGVAAGRAVVSDAAGAIGFADGERSPTPGPNLTAATFGSAVLVLLLDGSLRRFDAGGAHELPGLGEHGMSWGPLVASGGIAIASDGQVNGEMISLDPANGAVRWRRTGRTAYPLVADGGVVVVGIGHGAIARIDPTTGADLWQATASTDVGELAVAGGRVIALGEGELVALNADTGEVAFRRPHGHDMWPTAAGGRLWLASPDRLTALDPTDGTPVDEVALKATDKPIGDGSLLVVPVTDGLVVLDAHTGTERYRLTEGGRYTGPVLSDGQLLAVRH
jgi:outer membrane protein assembly factor BamB